MASSTGRWPAVQPRKRQFLSTGTLLLLLLLASFYYGSWKWLRAAHSPHDDTVIEVEVPNTPPNVKDPEPTSLPVPASQYDATKVAFLAETRPLPHLPALYAHMTAVVPPEWKFKFMGSPEAIQFMKSNLMIKRLEDSGKLEMVLLPSNYSLASRETISQMFTDIHLYRDLLAPAEHLLVFQPDSIFCASAPRTVNDFLEYDWIGAPWSKTAQYGGNGGLSLRKVSKIVTVLEKESRRHGDGALEDLWLSQRLARLPAAKMAVADVSKTFSVESVWDDAPLGYHIGWLGVHHEQIWDEEDQVKHVLEYCPEVKIILGMKLDNDKPASIQKIESDASKKPPAAPPSPPPVAAPEIKTVPAPAAEKPPAAPPSPPPVVVPEIKAVPAPAAEKPREVNVVPQDQKVDEPDDKLVSHTISLLGGNDGPLLPATDQNAAG